MSILKTIKSLDNKFSWSFFGFIIGILGITYAIYIDQFKEESPKIVFDILSNSQVLSVKEELNRLEISYNGQNLKEQKKNLILLTIKIKNEGNQAVYENDYYSKIPFGLKLIDGKIVDEPQLINYSNNFLKENVIMSYDTMNFISINKIPIEENQYFTIKILTICDLNVSPTIIPVGKIISMKDEIEIRNSFTSDNKIRKSFIANIMYGDILIHITRFFFYLFVIFIFVIVIIFPFAKILEYFEKRKQIRIIKKFRKKTKIVLTENIEIIFDIYLEQNDYIIKWLSNLLSENVNLKKNIDEIRQKIDKFNSFDDRWGMPPANTIYYERNPPIFLLENNLINRLVEKKILVETGDEFLVEKEFKDGLIEFNYFLTMQ